MSSIKRPKFTHGTPSTRPNNIFWRQPTTSPSSTSTTNPSATHSMSKPSTPAFSLVVVGSGGGPLENNLSSYFVKPYNISWNKEGAILGLDAGSSTGALTSILSRSLTSTPKSSTSSRTTPTTPVLPNVAVASAAATTSEKRGTKRKLSPPPPPSTTIATKAYGDDLLPDGPFRGLELPKEVAFTEQGGAERASGWLWGRVRNFLLSHSHLDHTLGLIVSSPSISQPTNVYGLQGSLEVLHSCFDDKIWPQLSYLVPASSSSPTKANLQQPKDHINLFLRPVPPNAPFQVGGEGAEGAYFEATPYEVNHGGCLSTAFFISSRQSIRNRNDQSQQRSFLFFGDVEPDSLHADPSRSEYGRNKVVWKECARRIVEEELSHVFLECSYGDERKKEELYGHLCPRYLVEELGVLADEVRIVQGSEQGRKGKLKGITVVVTHIKDEVSPIQPPSPTHDSPGRNVTVRDHENESGNGILKRQRLSSPSSPSSTSPYRSSPPNSPSKFQNGNSSPAPLSHPSPPPPSSGSPSSAKPETIADRILRELEEWEEQLGLGVTFVIAKQGMRIDF
ncbi:hypothetical protein BT69DRAFT_1282989 [Atractiella rhizophila]|nr:hypothetical protein BT69DRAFT_1282989 [Atractiella rhizophila]